ncbi:hypothetical protein AG1IA_04417 [Rhizoctonia solani AG-1 IA]|uniref:Uncharacterized protein n=1 Tax=Thanatephorus cucumeris (strain AG1-IA) TaxID=983506 RepID=L8WU60_THACA|nr:hypothetical protein AG1IA_04417 [Rhizoctonia solani AG-1 IA]
MPPAVHLPFPFNPRLGAYTHYQSPTTLVLVLRNFLISRGSCSPSFHVPLGPHTTPEPQAFIFRPLGCALFTPFLCLLPTQPPITSTSGAAGERLSDRSSPTLTETPHPSGQSRFIPVQSLFTFFGRFPDPPAFLGLVLHRFHCTIL